MLTFKPNEEVLQKLNNAVEYEEFEVNQNYIRRDSLLGVSVPWDQLVNDPQYSRMSFRFENLTVEKLQQLILENFTETSLQCNNQQPVSDLFHFMSKWPVILANGSVGRPLGRRPNYSFRIDEFIVSSENVTEELRHEFKDFCSTADEVVLDDKLYCWWD